MHAIQTEYIGQTAKRSAKVVAKYGISKVSVPFDTGISEWQNHANAARKIADELSINKVFVGASFAGLMYWVPADSIYSMALSPVPQELPKALGELPAIPHAADPQSAPMEGSTALPDPAPEPAKPARVRRAA